MGLERYAHINDFCPLREPDRVKVGGIEKIPTLKLGETLINITLADRSPETASVVVVHRLAEFRRKNANILLIPDVQVEIDRLLLEEVIDCIPIL
jgi:hypothetical protein